MTAAADDRSVDAVTRFKRSAGIVLLLFIALYGAACATAVVFYWLDYFDTPEPQRPVRSAGFYFHNFVLAPVLCSLASFAAWKRFKEC
ncbi:hypothetical protein [Alienimonas chondri]|uniref:Uncharacterized protein n=1 Tax=Alienimonas chondri TaxID=2681879 RepID=A0ABX1VI18_9PLAN|nr:hypothetical protein [Alienimonas chondri]NNJ27096.1 hypothetical protein [Alienimonas chondri]